MRAKLLLCLSSIFAAGSCSAFEPSMVQSRMAGAQEAESQKLVVFDIHHSKNINKNHKQHSVRALDARAIGLELNNQFTWYGIHLEIGTPPQPLYLQLDTGSSDMWVTGSLFAPQESSTYKENVTDVFSITYADGTNAKGNYAQDTIRLADSNDIALHNANFAFAVASDLATSPQVCGIGMIGNEVSAKKFSNLPVQLKEQGHIQSILYSMNLRRYESPGQLVFGGVDHSKYDGTLNTVPITHSSQFFVELDGIYLENEPVYTQTQQVLLDSGTTNLVIPAEMASALISSVDPETSWVPGNTFAVDCSKITPDRHFDLSFSGALIQMPFVNIVDPHSLRLDGTVPDSGTCMLGIQLATDDNLIILGDKFLVGAYVVFDLENRQIALANSKNSDSLADTQLEAVTGSGQIPGAIRAPKYTSSISTSYSSPSQSASGKGNSDTERSDKHPALNAGSRCRNTLATLVIALFIGLL